MTALTLDLHGRRLEEAVSEVTMYLDRIRRTCASISSDAATSSVYVTIITGKGSHSSQGPVLRSAIQKLLTKRGMDYKIESHKGAFTVNALSGWDLYSAGPATGSKVLISDQQEFHAQAACKKKASYGASFCQATTGSAGSSTRRCSATESASSESTEPQPKHVALEMDAISLARQQSMADAQKQKNEAIKLRKQKRLEMKKAMEESMAESAVFDQCRQNEEAELRKVLTLSAQEMHHNTTSETEMQHLKLAIEQSLLDEQERKMQHDAMYEEDLNKVLEESVKQKPNQEELELLKILELSLREKEAEVLSEEDQLQKAIQLSQDSHDQQSSNEFELYQLSEEEIRIVNRQQVQIQVTDADWYYMDPQQKVQGPFESHMMRAWLAAGYFKGDLQISQRQNGPFFSLSTYFPFYLTTAFVPDID